MRSHLETTKAGRGLYEKFGFEVVEVLKIPGWDQMDFPIMIRNKDSKV